MIGEDKLVGTNDEYDEELSDFGMDFCKRFLLH